MNKKMNNEETYNSLAKKYGAIVAHDIVVLINKYNNDHNFKPDCLALIQLSEITHRIRHDIQGAIKEIRPIRKDLISDLPHLKEEIALYKHLWSNFLAMYSSYINNQGSALVQLKQAA